MESSKSYLSKNNILPKISFKDGQPHKVKLLKDKEDQITDVNGQVKEGVKYLVEENGTPKSFFTSSIGLVQKLAEVKEGTEVVIQMKSKKGEKGYISYFEVSKVDNEIPIIEEGDGTEQGFPPQEEF